jgi:hypothetical protein
MSRIVVVMQRTLNGPPQVFLAEPSRHPEASIPMSLNMAKLRKVLQKMKSKTGKNDAVIQEVGAALLKMLAKHPAIQSDVLPLLDVHLQHEEPIYLFMKDRNPELEQLPWEALHAPNVGFLSANKLFPMARAQKVAYEKSEWSFMPPLKMMAIMGASGSDPASRISAEGEWQSLYKALKHSKAEIKLRVLLCEEELKARIDAEAQDWITTDLLHDRDQLFNDIRDFAPHILHFFCHGVATPLPQLHVASWRNWETDTPGGIRIESSQLKQRADPHGNIWLVTLNCCESAQSAEGTGSLSMPMVCSLVNSGFPAVVGMREQVAEDFAHDFCHLFYDALLDDFADRIAMAKDQGAAEVHWACALFATRQRICEMIDSENVFSDVAARAREWTIPVIYTRLETFRLRLISTAGGTQDIAVPAATSPDDALEPQFAHPGTRRLTTKRIHQLAEEMSQLNEDRKSFNDLKSVVGRIDARLAEIEAELRA